MGLRCTQCWNFIYLLMLVTNIFEQIVHLKQFWAKTVLKTVLKQFWANRRTLKSEWNKILNINIEAHKNRNYLPNVYRDWMEQPNRKNLVILKFIDDVETIIGFFSVCWYKSGNKTVFGMVIFYILQDKISNYQEPPDWNHSVFGLAISLGLANPERKRYPQR